MEEDRDVLIILGHPFIAIRCALIEVEKEELTFRRNEEHITFSIYKTMSNTKNLNKWADVKDSCKEEEQSRK